MAPVLRGTFHLNRSEQHVLHGHTRKYASSFSKAALKKWATRAKCWLQENRDVHVYFDNDAEGAAPKNALTLLEMLH